MSAGCAAGADLRAEPLENEHCVHPGVAGGPPVECRHFLGLDPWANPVAAALRAHCPKLAEVPKWDVRHESLCAGTAAEKVGHHIMDLRIRTQGAADQSKLCRRFLLSTWGQEIDHVYEDNDALIDPASAYCCKCGANCSAKDLPRPDLATGGFPCKPWTHLRQTNGRTPKTGAPCEHPCYDTFTKGLPRYLSAKRPVSFWVEEVESILRVNPKTGQPYMNQVCQACSDEGYSVRALVLDHAEFVQVRRVRVFILGFHADAGAASAAEWALQTILAVMKARRADRAPVPGVWDLVDAADWEENARIADQQAPFFFGVILNHVRTAAIGIYCGNIGKSLVHSGDTCFSVLLILFGYLFLVF